MINYVYFFNIILYAIELLIWIYLGKQLFKLKYRFSIVMICTIASWILLSLKLQLLSIYDISDTMSMVVNWIIFMLLSIIIFQADTKRIIMWYIIYLMITAVSESMVSGITLLITDISLYGIIDNIYLILLSKAICFIIACLIIPRINFDFIQKSAFIKDIVIMLGVNLLILFLAVSINLVVAANPRQDRLLFAINNIEIFGVLIFNIGLILKISKKSQELIIKNQKLHNLEMQIKVNTQIEIAEKNLKAIRHDVSNTFSIIKGLVELKEYSELEVYVSTILQDINEANQIIIMSDKSIQALINSKVVIMNDKKINFIHSINFLSVKNFSSNDMCTMIGNMIDNAIEAAEKSDSNMRFVRFEMYTTEDEFHIICDNTALYPPLEKKGSFISDKKDQKTEHGIGFENIKNIVNKYGGNIHYTYSNNIFSLHLMYRIKYINGYCCTVDNYFDAKRRGIL